MQNKPQMVEAVMFFADGGIRKAMFFAEFEALLDGVVGLSEFADQQVNAAYLLINPRLMVRSAVFFIIDFDEQGKADTGWNMPLRHMADCAGRGPDMGAGPIRLACRSQCPVSWHQMHMWDPNLAPGNNDLVILREAVKDNRLGILVEDDRPAVELDRLQMAREEKWHAPPDPAIEQARKDTEKDEHEHRLKTAQLIKQLRLRIISLTRHNNDEVAKLKLDAEQQASKLNASIQSLQQSLQQKEQHNLNLKADLSAQAANLSNVREEMSKQLKSAEQHGKSAVELMRSQLESEMQAQLAASVADYKEQVASLTRHNNAEMAKLKLDAEQQVSQLTATIEALQQSLQQKEQHNLSLKAELSAQAANLSNVREEITKQLKSSEQHGESAMEQMRSQLESEMQAQLAAFVADYKEQASSLTQQNNDEAAKLKLDAEQQASKLNASIEALQQSLQQKEQHNLNLKAELSSQAANLSNVREAMSKQLKSSEQHGESAMERMRSQLEIEMQAQVAASVADYKEQVAIRDVELAYRNEVDGQLQQELNRLKEEREQLAVQGGDQILQRLSTLGVVFVVYHPGAGHLTIPLQEVARYQDNPMGYVAAKCFVSEETYCSWLAHYQQPTCEASMSNGERCAMPIDRIDTPSRFTAGDSNCCGRHRSSKRRR